MRLQRHSGIRSVRAYGWRSPSLPWTFAAAGGLLAGAAVCLSPAPAAAEDEILDSGFGVEEHGMPASNPRVKPLLAGHPNDLVTICVAGCGKPTIVQLLPKPREKRVGSMRTTAADGSAPARRPAYDAVDRNDVLCVAGCGARGGHVVQRLPALPPVKVHREPADDDNRSEPLEVR